MARCPYVPAPNELGSIARLSLDNSLGLLGDARVLMDAGRPTRALALALLSAEEFGKAFLCTLAVGRDPSNLEVWRQFWRDFRDHRPKLLHWHGQLIDLMSEDDAQLWDELWADIKKLTGVGLDLKMACFYVDFRNGVITSPMAGPPEPLAGNVIASVALVVESTERMWEGVNLEEHFEDAATGMRELMAKMIAVKSGSAEDKAAVLELVKSSSIAETGAP